MRVAAALALSAAGMSALAGAATAAVTVTDDLGQPVTLQQPAHRIVSLAPHATELLFAAGAGERLVGASNFSDYPAAAARLPSVGSYAAFDLERVLALKPDLVVAWHSGNKPAQLARLREHGIPVFESQPTDFDMIADSMQRLAQLAGDAERGRRAAEEFRARWQTLQQRYRGRSQVSVFYQIWSQPLMTLNGQHMVSSVLRLCGGSNIFGQLPQLAPTVSVEAVIAADPQVILGPSDGGDQPLERWRKYPRMQAVSRGQLYTVNADWLNRAGPRVLLAAEEVCAKLELARGR
ncbi:cobalamin-binding protein [Herbaspirillum sp. YR522]|uniref:cobalamin-binding protein n=1 Tax=Herbaspirillum sp. YR522 TaxID=1144342 RepID=UPI00026F53EC|nr:cobalamin-binding protein [Herbaspirillum sp. YR522]EJM99196.1 ABC-type Fe3+-hydroxamate transport system, periplasmic component [Herbaspirillum sp. YR522]